MHSVPSFSPPPPSAAPACLLRVVLLQNPDVKITATCIRVPVMRAHAESINLTFKDSLTEEKALELLSSAKGVSIINDRKNNRFPTPLDASNKDDVYVGRIRNDVSQPLGKGLDIFVCGDQIRKVRIGVSSGLESCFGGSQRLASCHAAARNLTFVSLWPICPPQGAALNAIQIAEMLL